MSDQIFRSSTDTSPGFALRHIGPRAQDQQQMLAALGLDSLRALAEQVVPASIREDRRLALPAGASEEAVLARLRELADANRPLRSFIGQGYYNTHTPPVIQRNVLENPAWYTAYTPYQPEISQGRLEAMLSFQTMVSDLCGLEIANASLLDEGTAAAEAMAMCRRQSRQKSNRFYVAEDCFQQTIDVVRGRAGPLGIDVVVGPADALPEGEFFGALVQYPGGDGEIRHYAALAEALHEQKGLLVVATDLLALTLLQPPGEWGADVAVGSTQRFGVPMGFGGPHAGFMATSEAHKRAMPGRLVGVSIDRNGDPAYRLALQTREQHIRREKATSNICTAQVLLAVMASMYAVYHGPEGLCAIAGRVARMTTALAAGLRQVGLEPEQSGYFDTFTLATGERTAAIHAAARNAGINLREIDTGRLGLSLDETVNEVDLAALLEVFGADPAQVSALLGQAQPAMPLGLRRTSEFMQHPCFHEHRSETDMLRYLRRLADRDLALDRSMIPLGSCTMKLNATAEMVPITWPEFGGIHPFAPHDQVQGYLTLIDELERMLCEVTGYDAVSLQPNAGSQGEYAGLLAISAYHRSRGDTQRDVCLIPASAHGTNPASAQMAGMRVVVVRCDHDGNVDLEDLRAKAAAHAERLAAIMITYPSTHGVFEAEVREVCKVVHDHGGQVYIDGANLNAMVGVCYPGEFGGDVSHLNLHKTFAIPHGGGGPGVGPVAVRAHLAPFLPGHRFHADAEARQRPPVAAAPWGSAGILPISWAYMKLMGAEGLRDATLVAILNANYVAQRLDAHYPVLYSGPGGRVAHECILDLRPIKEATGITVDDVAKRLIDYGFHAPTMSFPVAGTLMVEPTESESLQELERFCEAMIAIREEIRAIEQGRMDPENNPLKNAPHTAADLAAADWPHPYSREQAVFPLAAVRAAKYWPPVARIDNVYGDRNLICACPLPGEYESA